MPKPALIPLLLFCLFWSGCAGPGSGAPKKFDTPIESRLALQVPYYPDGAGSYSQAALAAVMTYNGRPMTMAEANSAFGRRILQPRNMAIHARNAGLKAEFFRSAPEYLIEAVRQSRPVIVRLGADAAPLRAGHYAVVVGYTQAGVVVNSTGVHQQIVDWPDFLTAWLRASNLAIMIEPL